MPIHLYSKPSKISVLSRLPFRLAESVPTLAAQVSHITFYLQSLEGVITGGDFQQVDWGEIWRTVNQVTQPEWEGIQSELHRKYEVIQSLVREKSAWIREEELDSILGIIAHSAYHLGEIRQALCTIVD